MIPVLSEVIEYEGLSIWQTTDGRIGTGFEVLPCDIECDDVVGYHHRLTELLRSLSPLALGRINVSSEKVYPDIDVSRKEMAKKIGFRKKSVLLYIEIIGEPYFIKKLKDIFISSLQTSEIKSLLETYEKIKSSNFITRPMTLTQIQKAFIHPKQTWIKAESHLDNGQEVVGVLRLSKLKSLPLSETTISNAINKLNDPFEIFVSFQKIDEAKASLSLEKRLRQSNFKDAKNKELQNSTNEIISQSLRSGSKLMEFEFLVVIKRGSEKELKNELKFAQSVLNEVAEFSIETYGAGASWLATLLGNSQHVTIKELDEVLSLLLPVWTQKSNLSEVNQRSLLLHRVDQTPYVFDLFDPRMNVYNTLIVGQSGKGKSVLTGLMTEALLHDPEIQIIKVDVGGSHAKECELLGGRQYVFELNKASGLNPLSIIHHDNISQSEKVSILAKFIQVLILEQGETYFKKELRAKIEDSIAEYIPRAKLATLQEFFDMAIDFPRRDLLRRWVQGGVYQSAFACKKKGLEAHGLGLDSKDASFPAAGLPRLQYYNFSQIFQASDPEFAQAGLAAVLAEFNAQVLSSKKRIVLICDETPFFVRQCFDFFKFSVANVRKFGHAVILIAQNSTDLVINEDSALIDNSPQRFLFSIDGDENEYQNRFRLSPAQMEHLKTLHFSPKKESSCLLQKQEESRVIKIKVTPEEYWQLTSQKEDREKLEKLRAHIPELKLSEAIKCLGV